MVTCDKCRAEFRITPKERPLDDGGVAMEFSCPKCSEVYHAATISAKGLRLRRQLQIARRKGDRRWAERLHREYQREVTV